VQEGLQDVSLNGHSQCRDPHASHLEVHPVSNPSQSIVYGQQHDPRFRNQGAHDPRVQQYPVQNHVFQPGASQPNVSVLTHQRQLYGPYEHQQHMQQQPHASGGVSHGSPSLVYRDYGQQSAANSSYPNTGSSLAGMHNLNPSLGLAPSPYGARALDAAKPPPPTAPFSKVIVSDPLLISSSGASLFGLRQPPYWSYQIQTTFAPSGVNAPMGNWLVRRRFRHVVALEERLRQECPGAILPPRYASHEIENARLVAREAPVKHLL
jgi:hypothetical protein